VVEVVVELELSALTDHQVLLVGKEMLELEVLVHMLLLVLL
jgi:hypothetical protein